MSKALLDTDILSEYLKGHNRTVIRRAAAYAQQQGIFTFTNRLDTVKPCASASRCRAGLLTLKDSGDLGLRSSELIGCQITNLSKAIFGLQPHRLDHKPR